MKRMLSIIPLLLGIDDNLLLWKYTLLVVNEYNFLKFFKKIIVCY